MRDLAIRALLRRFDVLLARSKRRALTRLERSEMIGLEQSITALQGL